MPVEITIDASRAIARFSPAGIPEQVRNNLRRLIPDLTRRFGAEVERKMFAGLRSSGPHRLQVQKQMIENPTQVVGRVEVVWKGPASGRLVPTYLEEGTRPHVIAARFAPSLVFFWAKMGRWVAFKQVNHPGTKGIHMVADTFAEMQGEIRATLARATEGV